MFSGGSSSSTSSSSETLSIFSGSEISSSGSASVSSEAFSSGCGSSITSLSFDSGTVSPCSSSSAGNSSSSAGSSSSSTASISLWSGTSSRLSSGTTAGFDSTGFSSSDFSGALPLLTSSSSKSAGSRTSSTGSSFFLSTVCGVSVFSFMDSDSDAGFLFSLYAISFCETKFEPDSALSRGEGCSTSLLSFTKSPSPICTLSKKSERLVFPVPPLYETRMAAPLQLLSNEPLLFESLTATGIELSRPSLDAASLESRTVFSIDESRAARFKTSTVSPL